MKVDVSKISKEKMNTLFLSKYKDYLSLMGNFMTPEMIDERRIIVINNFKRLSTDFFNQKKEHNLYTNVYDRFRNDVRFLDVFAQIDYEFEKNKVTLENIFNNEISFLDYITTDFDLTNGELHGLLHKSSDGTVHHESINKALTYSIINTIGFGKYRKGEPFDYPEEMESNEELSLYQVRDVLAMDMMELFGDSILVNFFLGNGAKFSDDFRHVFMVYTTTEDVSTDEEIIKKTIQNMDDFEAGVDQSFKKNDETYYPKYMSVMKELKGVVNSTDFTYADEVYGRVKRGLK